MFFIGKVIHESPKIEGMRHLESLTLPADLATHDVGPCAIVSKDQIQKSGSFRRRQCHEFLGTAVSNRHPKAIQSLVLNFRLNQNWLGLRLQKLGTDSQAAPRQMCGSVFG